MEILTDHKRAAVGIKDEMTKLFFNLGARHASLHNHGMSCRLIQTSVTIDTGYVPGCALVTYQQADLHAITFYIYVVIDLLLTLILSSITKRSCN